MLKQYIHSHCFSYFGEINKQTERSRIVLPGACFDLDFVHSVHHQREVS